MTVLWNCSTVYESIKVEYFSNVLNISAHYICAVPFLTMIAPFPSIESEIYVCVPHYNASGFMPCEFSMAKKQFIKLITTYVSIHIERSRNMQDKRI